MKSVFLAQWMKDKRSPFLVLTFLGLSIAATLIFGGNIENKQRIGVFTIPGLEEEAAEQWLDRMNQSELYTFFFQSEDKARNTVREGRAEVAVQLMNDDYRLIAAMDNYTVQLVDHHLMSVFAEELQIRAAAERAGIEDAEGVDRFREKVARHLESPVISVHVQATNGDVGVSHNMGTQLLFAFSLFLAMFTIGMKINQITSEKASGIWTRVILSPLSKVEQYSGHLLYSSLIGFIQIAVVLAIFRYGLGFDLGERFDMLLVIAALFTLSTVAFAILFAGVIRTPEQFLMIYPSVIPIIPIISGAYMPPGTITSPVLLTVAQMFPLSHAMDALIGAALHDQGWADLFAPLAKLLLIGVVCMGVGMNLLERRQA